MKYTILIYKGTTCIDHCEVSEATATKVQELLGTLVKVVFNGLELEKDKVYQIRFPTHTVTGKVINLSGEYCFELEHGSIKTWFDLSHHREKFLQIIPVQTIPVRTEQDIIGDLRNVECALSPENLNRDGEASISEANNRYLELRVIQATLLKELGRQPTHEEFHK
jgi:hypothetical protein